MIIPLPEGLCTVIDDDDGERVARFRWFLLKRADGRVVARGKVGYKQPALLHRFILSAPPHLQVDHINGCSLDNRRANLRLCTNAQNAMNRHKSVGLVPFKGVYWNYNHRKFAAHIKLDGKLRTLGAYTVAEDAARAYDAAARVAFGEFARTNFP